MCRRVAERAKCAGVPLKRWAGERLGPEGASVYTRDPDANLLEFIVYGDG